MANGNCSKCNLILEEGSCSPSVLKSRRGQCRKCNTSRARELRRGDLSYHSKRHGLCSKCSILLTANNCRPSILDSGHGYCYKCTKVHRKEDFLKDPYKFKYIILKSNAKRHSRIVGLTLEEYREIIKDKPCSYCGLELNSRVYGYGLDRVDHNKDYVLGNCVPCCWGCNAIKGRIEGLGFSSNRSVELLKELSKIRSSESVYGHKPNKRKHTIE